MSELEELIETAFDAMYTLRDANKYKVSLGFFQRYAIPTPQSDPEGKRFCDLKLYAKDPNSNDVSILGVPLAYIGNKNSMIDFKLQKGDDLLVLFSDKSLSPWKEKSGTEPQLITDLVRDSKNHAFAIPVVTTHYSSEVIQTPVDDDALGIRVRPGKKLELGDGTNELLDLFNQALTEIITLVGSTILGGSNPVDIPGDGSLGTLNLIATPLASVKSNLTAIQTALGNIKV